MYGSTLSLTSALDVVGGQRYASAALPPGKIRYPLYGELGRAQGRSGQVRKSRSQRDAVYSGKNVPSKFLRSHNADEEDIPIYLCKRNTKLRINRPFA